MLVIAKVVTTISSWPITDITSVRFVRALTKREGCAEVKGVNIPRVPKFISEDHASQRHKIIFQLNLKDIRVEADERLTGTL